MRCANCNTPTNTELCQDCREALREPTQAEINELVDELEEILED